MKNKERKITLVKIQLKETGKVSRNWALRNRISRLGSIINDLIAKGWVFKSKKAGSLIMRGEIVDGDYVYTVTKIPKVR